MIRIESTEDIKNMMRAVKNGKRGFVSNFFLNPLKHDSWIRRGELSYTGDEECFFLVHATEMVDEVYYMTTSYDTLNDRIVKTWDKFRHPSVIQTITTDDEYPPLHLPVIAELTRMSRAGLPSYRPDSAPGIRVADNADLERIRTILMKNFDPITESIPDIEELSALKEHTLLCEKDGEVAGLIIFELNKTTLHLRYWWTSVRFRNRGIGAALINEFFNSGRDSLRQILWVNAENGNAIARYKHYGFVRDKVRDVVFRLTNDKRQ